MKSTRALGAIAAGAMLFAACGGGSATDSAPESDAVPAATNDAAPAALQFSAPLVGGGELDASTLAGKPTVFWFWAPT
jgi:hypothetical protein